MNPRSRDEIKNPFCESSKTKTIKDNDKPTHWVVHSKLVSLYRDYSFKRTPKFDENQAIVNGNTEE